MRRLDDGSQALALECRANGGEGTLRPMDSGREIELKLSVRPDRLERVMRSPHLQGEGARRAISRALKNIYYDTPHLPLRERGLVVRVREAGRRYIQTVKSRNATGSSGLSYRPEDHPA